MSSERWEHIQELYHAALELEPTQRSVFLKQACGDDEALRREVEALLAEHGKAGSFLEIPALDLTAQVVAETPSRSLVGKTLGAYRILSLLGSGGMGQVYQAQDTRLGRKVALKLLSARFTEDPNRLRRFEREARAASALNHPNILTIHEIGTAAGTIFIATEFIDGQTLREQIRQGKMKLRDKLEVCLQAAGALAVAHEAGIVHRDIKPENLMLRRDGIVKVLDFGLAKLVELPKASLDSDTTTQENWPTATETLAGTVMGTVPYMSPEQVEGRPVDHRSDIFSLGGVLYELLTSQQPFTGKSTVDVLHAIVYQEPRPATELNPQLPDEVGEILGKALAKDLGQRYRHVGDFELDLRRFKQAVESGTRQRTQVRQATKPRIRRVALAGVAAGVLLTLAVALPLWWQARSRNPVGPADSLEKITLTPVTTDPGYEGEPTFAPDGETIAYVSDRTGNFEIFLKQTSGGRDINLTNDPADDIQPAFSPDGKLIAFVSSRSGTSAILPYGLDNPLMGGDIWVMPALGGSARRIAERGNFPSWSPDGSHILYISGSWFGKKLYRVPAAGGKSEEIPVKLAPTNLWMSSSYSPDGHWIVFEATGPDIYVVRASGGEPQRIARGRRPLWCADGRAIIYSSQEPGRNFSLWRVPFSTAESKATDPSQPLTISHGRDLAGSASRDGKRIAFTAQEQSFNLEIMPFDAEAGRELGKPEQLTFGMQSIYFWSFSPNGHSLVFDSRRGAGSNIWRLDRGSAPVALTSDVNFDDGSPRWSPDGSRILFTRRSAKDLQASYNLWLMTADGASPALLVEGAGAGGAGGRWLPDGRGVIYFRSGQLHRLDLETNQSRQLTSESHVMPITTISPDGRWVVYQSTASGNVDLRVVPAEGGPSRVVIATPGEDYHPFVSPSGRWLYFQPDHKNLFRVPGPAQSWRQAPPEKVTHFPESGLSLEDTQASPDGRQLAYSRGRITGDVWILNFGE